MDGEMRMMCNEMIQTLEDMLAERWSLRLCGYEEVSYGFWVNWDSMEVFVRP